MFVDMGKVNMSFLFRKAVKLSCKSSNILLLCHYHINNTTGQFSFIGGYFKDKDTVLILTPSKSKFLARWVPTLLMWKILLNDVTGEQDTSKGELVYFNSMHHKLK